MGDRCEAPSHGHGLWPRSCLGMDSFGAPQFTIDCVSRGLVEKSPEDPSEMGH